MGVKLAKMDALQRPNLLVNADFRKDIINQKGQNAYSKSGSWLYGPDMWSVINGGIILQNGYLNLYGTDGYFRQFVEGGLKGVYTVTIKVIRVNSGSLGIYLEASDATGGIDITKAGTYTFTFGKATKGSGLGMHMSNFNGDIEFIKLEEGSIFTGMPVYNSALELVKCKRFFQIVDFEETIWCDMYNLEFVRRIELDVYMHKIPSVTCTIFDNYNVSSQRALPKNAKCFYVNFKFSSDAGQGHRVGMQITLDAYDY